VKARLLSTALLHARPPRDRRRDERGACSVCGRHGRLAFNSWVIPRDGWSEEHARRESLFCAHCRSSQRVRRVADVLVAYYADAARSVATLVEESGFRGLRTAEINAAGPLHRVLARHPDLTYSEYPDEDLTRLSYADGSFDLVVHAETLEHVPDPDAALRELRRVLRRGGRTVFTTPVDLERERSAPPAAAVYHGRGSGLFALARRREDHLVRTEFGRDLLNRMERAGLEPETHFDGGELVLAGAAR